MTATTTTEGCDHNNECPNCDACRTCETPAGAPTYCSACNPVDYAHSGTSGLRWRGDALMSSQHRMEPRARVLLGHRLAAAHGQYLAHRAARAPCR